jgi:hypothetical protein
MTEEEQGRIHEITARLLGITSGGEYLHRVYNEYAIEKGGPPKRILVGLKLYELLEAETTANEKFVKVFDLSPLKVQHLMFKSSRVICCNGKGWEITFQ